MCRPEATAYGCLHSTSTPLSSCTNRLYLDDHQHYKSSSNAKLRRRYKYMKSRCRRDRERGATVLYLRMDIVCEDCENDGKELEKCDVIEIIVDTVEIQVLRGKTAPQGLKRKWENMTEARDGNRGRSQEAR